ncbi:hypothetical protein [Brevibacillus dissolubilis]|uniref:hypothetical protein n=1 Tax=Brevibacillus dissolubilis TaxID=1844116 RepID=UPI001116B0EB|nr:hypothetical protein [Brevibacillus dissolubilis]
MLTFDEKLAILESFPELTRNNVSLGRVNFHYEDSLYEKKTVAYHLHPNGNGFVYAGLIKGYKKDDKGMVNIRDFQADELREIVEKSIQALSTPPKEKTAAEAAIIGDAVEERWVDRDGHTLILIQEDDLWNVYSGLNLDGAFESYVEAEAYLKEEGFRKE